MAKGRVLRRCRVVIRSNNNANANGGLVYANANNASANSNTNNGARLTFKRKSKLPKSNKNRETLNTSRVGQSFREEHEPRQPSPKGRKPEHDYAPEGRIS